MKSIEKLNVINWFKSNKNKCANNAKKHFECIIDINTRTLQRWRNLKDKEILKLHN